MNKTGKMVTLLILAGAMTVLTACGSGGGGSATPTNGSAAFSTPGYLNTTGNRGYVNPGQYVGVVSMSMTAINTPQYGYFMSMLNMSTISMNFQVTVSTNGQVPGSAGFIIQPMRQNGYYNQAAFTQGVPGLNDQAETAANGTNGMILTYYQPENSQPCMTAANCNNSLPDIQIVAVVANTQANTPGACGGGFGFRPAMTVQIRVKGATLGSGTLCSNGNVYGGNQWNRGYQYQQQWVYR